MTDSKEKVTPIIIGVVSLKFINVICDNNYVFSILSLVQLPAPQGSSLV